MNITTIKLTEDTKNRLLKLDIAEKGKSFDILINELISSHEKNLKKYQKDYKDWEIQNEKSKKAFKEWGKRNEKYEVDYEKEKQIWNKLLKWAKSKGFKE